MEKLLSEFPNTITLPVQWGEQDAFGHVNNLIYIRWFESGRIAYLEQAGIWRSGEPLKIGPILASITCHFRRPVKYPDTVHIGTRVTRIGRTSMTVEHRILNSQHQVVAEGDSVVVMYDYEKSTPRPVPDEMRQAISRLEGREL